MEPLTAGLLFLAALFAGVLNAIAGGATFFTFPALIFSGMSPMAANATNFVALVPGNVAALPAYRMELRSIGRELFGLLLVAGVGGITGAILLLWLGGWVFEKAVPYLMASATLLFAVAPIIRRRLDRRKKAKKNLPLALFLLFIYAVYGGYFGAGLGQIMLAALILYGYDDFHIANALKNAVISAISLIAVMVYAFSGAVVWPEAVVMMVGAGIGGYVGGRVSLEIQQSILRAVVIVFGTFLTGYYFVAGA